MYVWMYAANSRRQTSNILRDVVWIKCNMVIYTLWIQVDRLDAGNRFLPSIWQLKIYFNAYIVLILLNSTKIRFFIKSEISMKTFSIYNVYFLNQNYIFGRILNIFLHFLFDLFSSSCIHKMSQLCSNISNVGVYI